MTIEPPNEIGAGVCHWCCMYVDLDVAKKMLQTKNVKINRFDENKKTGPFMLIEKKTPEVVRLIKLLIDRGLNVNLRYDENSPTILEFAIGAISKNYEFIKTLIEYGANINALHSKQKTINGERMTLLDFVRERQDNELRKIFGIE